MPHYVTKMNLRVRRSSDERTVRDSTVLQKKHNQDWTYLFLLFPHLLLAQNTVLQSKQIIVNMQVILCLVFFFYLCSY